MEKTTLDKRPGTANTSPKADYSADAMQLDDVHTARTLPAGFYRDPAVFELAKERIFVPSWQFALDTDKLKCPGQVVPWTLAPGFLDEPLLFTRDQEDRIHCMSNVCTHRGSILVEGECNVQTMRCRYHGRRFGLDGNFLSAPGFEEAKCFPTEEDNLVKAQMETWGKFIFCSIAPGVKLDEVIGDMKRRLYWLPLEKFEFDPAGSRDYYVNCNWALYVDNYLEGFHVPYVHPELARLLDVQQYRDEVQPFSTLQIGIGSDTDDCFDLPADSPDYGQKILAYYYWLFPNTMLNFYPWGLSVNIVNPVSVDRCVVKFLTYIWDESKMGSYSLEGVDRTQREDEQVVELVQKGIQSRLYHRGRYSPRWEAGVHHFHKLLLERLGS